MTDIDGRFNIFVNQITFPHNFDLLPIKDYDNDIRKGDIRGSMVQACAVMALPLDDIDKYRMVDSARIAGISVRTSDPSATVLITIKDDMQVVIDKIRAMTYIMLEGKLLFVTNDTKLVYINPLIFPHTLVISEGKKYLIRDKNLTESLIKLSNIIPVIEHDPYRVGGPVFRFLDKPEWKINTRPLDDKHETVEIILFAYNNRFCTINTKENFIGVGTLVI